MTGIATAPTPIVAPVRPPGPSASGDRWVSMRGVGWSGYSTLLDLRGSRRYPKLLYLDGDVWLMSPAFPHEHYTTRLGRFILALIVELDIPCVSTRALTLRLENKEGGVEADESYYLANAGLIQGLPKIDMATFPTPDLTVEVVISHPATHALEIYRRLGVPEVWFYDGEELLIHVFGPDARYAIAPSLAFSFVSPAEVHEWVSRPQEYDEARWFKDVSRWVAETLPARWEAQR